MADDWVSWIEVSDRKARARKILLVVENPQTGELMRSLLDQLREDRFDYELVNEIPAALDRLQIGGFDALLFELTLLYYEDVETLLTLHPQLLEVATVVLANPGSESTAVKATQLGFHDYFVVGRMDSRRLRQTIDCAIEQQRVAAELRKLKMINELTGLYTFQAFLVLSQHFLKLANRTNRGLLLFIIKLAAAPGRAVDAGNEGSVGCFVDAANIVKSTFRRSDIIAQLDHEEFYALALESRQEGAAIISDRIRKNNADYFVNRGTQAPLSLDIASAYYDPALPCSIVELAGHARKNS